MRPVVFSASSVTAYQDCQLKWWFTYVLVNPGDQSEPQMVGIAVHDAAEAILTKVKPPDAFADWPPAVVQLIDVFVNDVLPTYRNPIAVELPFQLEVNDIPYSGFIDALDEQDLPWGYTILLRDTKTTRQRPRKGQYRFAMTGYWLGATDLGYKLDTAQLDWIVRTKTPYYWPEAIGPITDDDINLFVRTLEETAEGVERGRFEPTGLGTWQCKACEHTAICGPYQRYAALSGV